MMLAPPGVAAAVLVSTLAAGAPPARELGLGVPVEGELRGDTHLFRLTLGAGQYARVVVDQPGADVAVRVRTPAGEEIADVDGSIATSDPEHIAFVAAQDGAYEVEVRPTGRARTRDGRFVVHVDVVRDATDADPPRIAAERMVARASGLRFEETADAQRQAIALFEQALAAFTTLADPGSQAEVLNNMGETQYALGDLEGARHSFLRALPLWRESGEPREEAQTLNDLGVIQRLTGEMDKALETYTAALALRRATGDRRGEAQTLRNIGVVHALLDQYQEAIDRFQESLPIRRETGDVRGEAYTLHSIGAHYFALGEYAKALDYAAQAVDLHRKGGDSQGEAQSLQALAQAHAALGERAKAEDLLQTVLALRRASGDALGEGGALWVLGQQRASAGAHGLALELFGRALGLLRTAGDRRGESDVLQAMGDSYAALGEHAKAAEHYEEALAVRRATGDRSGEAASLLGLAHIQRASGRLGESRASTEAALAITDTIRATIVRHDLRASYQAARQAEYEFYVDLLMEQHRREPGQGHAAAAFLASERARARSLRDMLLESKAQLQTGVDSDLLAAQRRLDGEVRARERVRLSLLDARGASDKVDEVRREIEARLTEQRDLEGRIRARSPRYAALTQPPAPTLAEVQALLDPDTLLLEYALGTRRSWLFAVTPTSLDALELPPREPIEALARRFYGLMRSSHQTLARGAAASAAAELSRMVLGPVAGRLAGHRLVIVGEGALQYVPFAALPAPGDPSLAPLLTRHEVVHLPSMLTLSMLREEAGRPRAARTVAVFADPVLDRRDPRVRPAGKAAGPLAAAEGDLARAAEETETRFARLTYSRQEAQAIAALAPASHRLVALDFEASRTAVLSAPLADFGILHFATHGLVNSRHPELSGVVLSLVDRDGRDQDGFLRLHDIYNLSLRADLVVLSACRTALGQDVRGEGLVGLTRGFMYAGAPRVMASLWDVRDEATARLMRRFYSAMLRDGLTPAAALRKAQLSMMEETRWRAPFYWAAFTLQGDWR
jgi:CHAT domain-containing protein/tetratricopeptide (TPR) repeat protein